MTAMSLKFLGILCIAIFFSTFECLQAVATTQFPLRCQDAHPRFIRHCRRVLDKQNFAGFSEGFFIISMNFYVPPLLVPFGSPVGSWTLGLPGRVAVSGRG